MLWQPMLPALPGDTAGVMCFCGGVTVAVAMESDGKQPTWHQGWLRKTSQSQIDM
jgi:hypothetical protein